MRPCLEKEKRKKLIEPSTEGPELQEQKDLEKRRDKGSQKRPPQQLFWDCSKLLTVLFLPMPPTALFTVSMLL